MSYTRVLYGAGALLASMALVTSSVAVGDVTQMVFTVEASNTSGTGSFEAIIDSADWISGQSCVWTLDGPVNIVNRATGAYIATLQGGGAGYLTDPAVNLSFSVLAGPSTTVFTIKSALLSFPEIAAPRGRASAAFTVTDGVDDDGALLSGLAGGGDGGAYLAQYNGFVPGGTTFAELIEAVNAPAMGTGSVSEDYPGAGDYFNIGTSVSNMSTEVSFMLSANDLASGTSNFEVIPVPEPSSVLFVLALTLARRRS